MHYFFSHLSYPSVPMKIRIIWLLCMWYKNPTWDLSYLCCSSVLPVWAKLGCICDYLQNKEFLSFCLLNWRTPVLWKKDWIREHLNKLGICTHLLDLMNVPISADRAWSRHCEATLDFLWRAMVFRGSFWGLEESKCHSCFKKCKKENPEIYRSVSLTWVLSN